MNVVRVWVAVSALALLRALPGVPAHASQTRTDPQPTAQSAVRMSLDQAVKMVETRFKARVLRADTRTQGGRVIYVMRLLDQRGRVFTVRVDAASGTIL